MRLDPHRVNLEEDFVRMPRGIGPHRDPAVI